MKNTYSISGMTCQNCVNAVRSSLSELPGVKAVVVDLKKGEVDITGTDPIALSGLQAALPEKYQILERDPAGETVTDFDAVGTSKWQQLRPLFLIFTYLIAATVLLHYKDGDFRGGMLDFMGLFYIVFSFFKLLDLKGFPQHFSRYDPLAKALPFYGWIYPFLELLLGLLFLLRIQVSWALIATLVLLGSTTFGVLKVLLDKKSIQCACLGTALKLPMTEATLIENAVMLIMAIGMLLW